MLSHEENLGSHETSYKKTTLADKREVEVRVFLAEVEVRGGMRLRLLQSLRHRNPS